VVHSNMENGTVEKTVTEEGLGEERKQETETHISTSNAKSVNPLRLARPLEKVTPTQKAAEPTKNGNLTTAENQDSNKDPLEINPSKDAEKNEAGISKSKTQVSKKEEKKPVNKPTPSKKIAGEKKPSENVAKKKVQNTKKEEEEYKPTLPSSTDVSARSKRSRAPRNVYEAPDPEMDQILKTIKKMEADDDVSKTSGEIEETNGEESAEKKADEEKPVEKTQKKKRKISISDEEEDEEDYVPEPIKKKKSKEKKEEEEDYMPEKSVKKKKKKPVSPKKTKSSSKKEPVFFKDEHLAVRNEGDGFYICRAKQNIFLGSRGINIQWWSNEEDVIPAKDNPEKNIYAADFYDKTDFETILTSVELSRRPDKGRGMLLPKGELERINKILKKAQDKAAGTLNLDSMDLTEDNPDGLDISLYKGEDQLDEIDKRRKADEPKKKPKAVKEKVTENSSSSPVTEEKKIDEIKEKSGEVIPKIKKVEKKPEVKKISILENKKKEGHNNITAEVKNVDEDPKIQNKTTEKESTINKKVAKPPLEETKVEVKESIPPPPKAEETGRKERRKASKNISYTQYDFLEDDDDEVMPSPKRRAKEKETEAKGEIQETPPAKAENGETKPKEILSTSERALLAEKAKIEASKDENVVEKDMEDEKENELEPIEEVDPLKSQPVKKRGRKAKPKE